MWGCHLPMGLLHYIREVGHLDLIHFLYGGAERVRCNESPLCNVPPGEEGLGRCCGYLLFQSAAGRLDLPVLCLIASKNLPIV